MFRDTPVYKSKKELICGPYFNDPVSYPWINWNFFNGLTKDSTKMINLRVVVTYFQIQRGGCKHDNWKV